MVLIEMQTNKIYENRTGVIYIHKNGGSKPVEFAFFFSDTKCVSVEFAWIKWLERWNFTQAHGFVRIKVVVYASQTRTPPNSRKRHGKVYNASSQCKQQTAATTTWRSCRAVLLSCNPGVGNLLTKVGCIFFRFFIKGQIKIKLKKKKKC